MQVAKKACYRDKNNGFYLESEITKAYKTLLAQRLEQSVLGITYMSNNAFINCAKNSGL